MKLSELEQLEVAGLITAEQNEQISAFFNLRKDPNKFLSVIAMLGACLVLGGICLWIGANWDPIPDWFKLGGGLVLMVASHVAGYKLKQVQGKYLKTAEACHLLGSGLWLGNICLVGQIFHVHAETSSGLLLWLVGIGPMPFLLKSRVQFILAIVGALVWFGLKINESSDWTGFARDPYQVFLYSLLGLLYLGSGYLLRNSRYAMFASDAERVGLAMFLLGAFPASWELIHDDWMSHNVGEFPWRFLLFAMVSTGTVVLGALQLKEWGKWNRVWVRGLVSVVVMMVGAVLGRHFLLGLTMDGDWYHYIGMPVLFGFSLLQVRVGVEARSTAMINWGMMLAGGVIIVTYICFIESMTWTGGMFVITGIVMMVASVILEKQRRRWIGKVGRVPQGG